ncbi:MAG: hypothetical protein KDB23_15825, partial [Planctomycetales bacterium]|nr:hypothetical protein [Planctomycetales bacterium]
SCGALVPFVGNGTLMVACLYLAGAGILGLHPYYYSMTQELSANRMGLYSGLLAAFGWTVSSVSQILLGRQIEASKSYAVGLTLVGTAPVLGLIAIVLFWPREKRA